MTHHNLKSLYILTFILLSSILLLIINFFEHTLYSLGIIALISYLIFFISWWQHYKVKFNFYSMFLVFTLAFYWGQFILLVLGVPFETQRTILDDRIPDDMLIKTGILILNSMYVLHMGVIATTFKINKYNTIFLENNQIPINYHKNNNSLKIVAYSMLFVSIIPSFYVLYNNFTLTLTQGYGAIFSSDMYVQGGFDNIIRFISLLTIPAFLMLFITCKNDKSLKYIVGLFVIYLSLYFMSGSRMSGVLLLSIILLVKHFWYSPIKFKKNFIIYLIFFFLAATLMSTISEVRNLYYIQGNLNSTFIEGIKTVFINNPLFTMLEETGFTFLATATVVTHSPLNVDYAYGLSYINSLLMIFPNLFWDVHPAAAMNTDIAFKDFYTQYGGIGSSFIAESYWNFGYFSIFLALIFGIILGKVTKLIAKYANNKNINMFFLMMYTSQLILTFVRSDTITFWRNFTYYGIFPLILAWLLVEIFGTSKKVRKIKKDLKINQES